MDTNILNLSQASEFLGISEKTLIKLLREEHIPARKIGREWRFSREALVRWLAAGDSTKPDPGAAAGARQGRHDPAGSHSARQL